MHTKPSNSLFKSLKNFNSLLSSHLSNRLSIIEFGFGLYTVKKVSNTNPNHYYFYSSCSLKESISQETLVCFSLNKYQ